MGIDWAGKKSLLFIKLNVYVVVAILFSPVCISCRPLPFQPISVNFCNEEGGTAVFNGGQNGAVLAYYIASCEDHICGGLTFRGICIDVCRNCTGSLA